MYWPHTAYFIIDAIFNGTMVAVIVVIIWMIFRFNLRYIDKQIFIRAVNCALLVASCIYALTFLMQLIIAFYSQADYEQYAVLNRLFGPYWYAAAIQLSG